MLSGMKPPWNAALHISTDPRQGQRWYAHEEPSGQERCPPVEPELTAGYEREDDDLDRDPPIRSEPFRDQLRWKLGDQEAQLRQRVAEVVV